MLGAPPWYVPALACLLAAVYVVAAVRFLWGERALVVAALLVVIAGAFAIRTYRFPPIHIDEGLTLECSRPAYESGNLTAQHCNELAALPQVLFELPLVPWLGPDVWAIRAYSLLGSCLALAYAFVLVRTMGGSVAAGLFAAVTLAAAPWSIFYARTYEGGEIVLNQLLLLAALARLAWRPPDRWSAFDAAAAAVAYALAFYTYPAARAVLPMPVVASLVARQWSGRILPVVAAAAGYWAALPYVGGGSRYAEAGLREFNIDVITHDWHALAHRTLTALQTVAAPVADDGWLSISRGGVVPPLLIALAGLGMVLPPCWRRTAFLTAAFTCGLVPGIVGHGNGISSHRELCAYAILPIAAAFAVDRVRPLAAPLAASVVAASLAIYWSPEYQAEMARWYDQPRTDLVRAFPAGQTVYTSDLWGFDSVRYLDRDVRPVDVESWITGQTALYAFGERDRLLLGFYSQLVGDRFIRHFGPHFLVEVPAGTWQGRHGWTYRVHCPGTLRAAIIPTLFHEYTHFDGLACPARMRACPERCPGGGAPTRTWDARWRGSPRRAWFCLQEGEATVAIDGGEQQRARPGACAELSLTEGASFHAEMAGHPGYVVAFLFVDDGLGGRRLPYWWESEPL